MKKIALHKILGVALIGVLVGMVIVGPGSSVVVTAQQAQPIPSANEDVRIVAGLLLAQELLDIASRTAVTLSLIHI